MKYKAQYPHNPQSGDFIVGSSGDRYQYERRETIYPGWIWCFDGRGNQAWVPEAYLVITGETCQLNRDYDSRELDLSVGEVVRFLDEESGWARIVNQNEQTGWVPLSCLVRLENGAG
jgi:hypothetical protein